MKVINTRQPEKKSFAGPLFTGPDVTLQTLLPESKEYPVNPSHHGMCYLPVQDKVLVTAGGKTWLFDVKTNQWADAQPKGNPPMISPRVP